MFLKAMFLALSKVKTAPEPKGAVTVTNEGEPPLKVTVLRGVDPGKSVNVNSPVYEPAAMLKVTGALIPQLVNDWTALERVVKLDVPEPVASTV
jgi:hypothetical protein